MSVLVDTPIWSLAFRRIRVLSPAIDRLAELISTKQAVMVGPVRQEILSGIRDQAHFARLRERLRSFPDVRLSGQHWELAAEFGNTCRSRGIQGSNTDFLICAVAAVECLPIFTTDQDFDHFVPHIPIRLHDR